MRKRENSTRKFPTNLIKRERGGGGCFPCFLSLFICVSFSHSFSSLSLLFLSLILLISFFVLGAIFVALLLALSRHVAQLPVFIMWDVALSRRREVRERQKERERETERDRAAEGEWVCGGGWLQRLGGTLSTRTEIAGGSLPSDPVLISPRISPLPLFDMSLVPSSLLPFYPLALIISVSRILALFPSLPPSRLLSLSLSLALSLCFSQSSSLPDHVPLSIITWNIFLVV